MRKVVLIYGPPCSGKTTEARGLAQPGDLVIDWDQPAREAGNRREHDHLPEHARAASRARMELEQHAATVTDGTAYIIRNLADEQVWALYRAMPKNARKDILLGAIGGLRVGEAVVFASTHLDAKGNILQPTIQYPADPLKTEYSKTPIPISANLTDMLLDGVPEGSELPFILGDFGRPIGPYRFEAMFRDARENVPGLPEGFRFHDLRHYFASLLIASGTDIKTLQHRVRHGSSKTTLDTYGHTFPDKDEASRPVIAAAVRDLEASLKAHPLETPAD